MQSRVAAYVDVARGEGILDGGARLSGPPQAPLSRILRALPPDIERLYLCGPRPGNGSLGGMLRWVLEDEALASDWQEQRPVGHYLPLREASLGLEDEPVLRLQHRETGRKLDVRRFSVWVGDGLVAPPAEARACLRQLVALLELAFGARATVYATPARTGQRLWGDLVYRQDFPILPDDLRALIRATSGQGRIELCPPSVPTIPAFYYLDGRFMYAGLVDELGSGPAVHDTEGTFERYRRGRYRIRFTVPRGWSHVGLFMVPRLDAQDGDLLEGERWQYPAEPGTTWETWVDGAELLAVQRALAAHPEQDWQIEILERLLLTNPAGKGPLHLWAKKLVELREGLAVRGLSPSLTTLLSAALRAILLHGIGAFHRAPQTVTRMSADPGRVPAGRPARKIGRYWLWQEQERASVYAAQFEHPEWSAAIWARCRARLLYHRYQREPESCSGVLLLPREQILAFRTDALYLTAQPPWLGERIGQFRIKGRLVHAVSTPQTYEELNALRDQSVAAWQAAHEEARYGRD